MDLGTRHDTTRQDKLNPLFCHLFLPSHPFIPSSISGGVGRGGVCRYGGDWEVMRSSRWKEPGLSQTLEPAVGSRGSVEERSGANTMENVNQLSVRVLLMYSSTTGQVTQSYMNIVFYSYHYYFKSVLNLF